MLCRKAHQSCASIYNKTASNNRSGVRRQSDLTANNRCGVPRQSGLAAALGGVILIIGGVSRHLRYRATGTPERAAAILAPVAGTLRYAVPRTDATARPCHDDHEEDGEGHVQESAQIRKVLRLLDFRLTIP